MRLVGVLALVLLQSGYATAQELWLAMALVRGERSKDSHRSQVTFTLNGTKLSYSGPAGQCVRGRCGESSKTFELTAGELAKVRSLISAKLLSRKHQESRSTTLTGNYVDTKLYIGRRGHMVHIAGMTSIWGRGAKKTNLSAHSTAVLDALVHFATEVTQMARARDGSLH
jgi:hypothetical protein